MKKLILAALHRLGYDLAPRDGRTTMAGALGQLRRAGLDPATVIDVGAAHGRFARDCARVFPRAGMLLIEPLAEYGAALADTLGALPKARLVAAAAGERDGDIIINVHPDLVGSSLFRESEESDVNGVPRTVAMVAVDTVAAELPGPILLKADVQGAELAVLAGAAATLQRTECVVLETSFFRFFDGAPLAFEVMAALRDQGFAVHDIVGLAHRPLDGALAQADIVFVREDSALRRHHHYASALQRAALTERLTSQ